VWLLLFLALTCSNSAFGGSSEFVGGFGSFTSFGEAVHSSPLSSTPRPLDLTSLPPELVVILKNIQKRDSTTKAKGVQDLTTKLSQAIDDHTLEQLLNIWVLLIQSPSVLGAYNRLYYIRR
jgi:E3 ubiquitin-protein ligase listerin